eukprot:GFKZ01007682.1.p1 GENE.GFKZ01007682.1~~GFKZ01007682.1.p1  ORF type:complete len:519 (-),score=80.76 GFKZ01007682.1:318-1874(-)
MLVYRSSVLFLRLGICVTLLCSCRASVVATSENPSKVPTTSGRFLFWERCEDEWNEEKGITETCCRGNYRCSSDICKDNAICRFGLLGNALWCHASKCTPKGGSGNDKEDDDDSNDDDDEEPQPSTEDSGEDEDEDEDEDGDEDGEEDGEDDNEDDEKEDDNEEEEEEEDEEEEAATPSPSAAPSPSRDPTPTPTPSPAPPVNNGNPLHCNGRRDRREIRDMTPEQRRRWQQAIIALRADRDENGDSEWDRLVRLHMDFNGEAHGGSYFLPWHRLFLLRLENALRRYEPNLALPYWDWAQDASDAARSPVWNSGYVGGARSGNRPIQNGPFQNMDARVPQGHIVRRDFTSGESGEIPLLWGISPLNQLIREPVWSDFSDGVEAAHALPHIYIGGDMTDAFRAPNDPVFYLHHTFIDWLWRERQRIRGANQFGGTHDFAHGTENAHAGRLLQAFGVPASTAFNLGCVNYVAPSRSNTNAGGRGTGSRQRPAQESCGQVTENSISPERCRHGLEVLSNEA